MMRHRVHEGVLFVGAEDVADALAAMSSQVDIADFTRKLRAAAEGVHGAEGARKRGVAEALEHLDRLA